MNEDRKKRGIKNHKILMTVAICALFLGSRAVTLLLPDLLPMKTMA